MTAQEFIDENEPVKMKEWRDCMIEFAQMHVKKALEEASWSLECYSHERKEIIDSYPLSNVK